MLSVNKTMKSRDEGVGGAGGEGVDGCPVLKLIAAFVQQDFQIEAFDNKEPDRPLAPSLPPSFNTESLAGLCGRASVPRE